MKKINLDELKLNNAKMSDDMLKEINGGCTGRLSRSEGCNGCRASYWIIDLYKCTKKGCWSNKAKTELLKIAEEEQFSHQYTKFAVYKNSDSYDFAFWN